ncbi:MAG: hypothetical protein ACRD96_16355 [Bryobacteraceae bacterium]
MRTAAVVLVAVALAGADRPRVSRASIVSVEKNFDQRIRRDDPYLLIGHTRGVYLEGYGVVLTSEANLSGMRFGPFGQPSSPEDIEKMRARKLQRLPQLRASMREMLLAAAVSLDEVPAAEQVAYGISLLYGPGEDHAGLPSQILMHGQRARLMDAKLGRAAADSVIKVQEF